MSIIKTPGGGVHFMVGTADDAAKAQAKIAARLAFALAYCAKKGWDHDDLSIGQILEIRAQPEWQAGGAL